MNLSINEKISALYLCADILDYPSDDYLDKLDNLSKIVKNLQNNHPLDFIESEHIRIFSIQSSHLRCVPYASWWIDGKMYGISSNKIDKFYKKCGYVFDNDFVNKSVDHISIMTIFIAILLEDNKQEEIKEFSKFLNWLDDFKNSLDKASSLDCYSLAIDLTIKIINSLKEEV